MAGGAAPDPMRVAQSFASAYYPTFNDNRDTITKFYQEQSKLTMEGAQIMGAQNIAAKHKTLPFKILQQGMTLDAQNSGGGILVLVTGTAQRGPEQFAKFSQSFHLLPTQNNSFWVHNEIFRIA